MNDESETTIEQEISDAKTALLVQLFSLLSTDNKTRFIEMIANLLPEQ